PKFLKLDRLLDAQATGPKWLGIPELAQIVINALFAGESKDFYELGAWVVMPNHVHVLLRPLVELSRVVAGFKATSAREANLFMNRTGAFWSHAYFDHLVRDSTEETRIVRYVENNPVKAGLVSSLEDFPFSSAHLRSRPDAAGVAEAP